MLAGSSVALSACGRLHYATERSDAFIPPGVDASIDAFAASVDAPSIDTWSPAVDADQDANSDAFAIDTNPPRTDFFGPLPGCSDVVASLPASFSPFNLVGAGSDSFFVMFRPDAARTYAGFDIPTTGTLMELSLAGRALRVIPTSTIGFVRQVEDVGTENAVLGSNGFGTLGATLSLPVEIPVQTDAEVPAFDQRSGLRLLYGAVNRNGRVGGTTLTDLGTGTDPLVAAMVPGASTTQYVRRISVAGLQTLAGAALLTDARAVLSFSILTAGYAVDGLPVARGDVVVLGTDGNADYVASVGGPGVDVVGEVHAHPTAATFYTEHIDGIDAHIAGTASATRLFSSRWTTPGSSGAQLVGFHVEASRVIAVVAFTRSITWGTFTATATDAGLAVFRLDDRGIPQAMRSIPFDGPITQLHLIVGGQAAFASDNAHVVFGFEFMGTGSVSVCGAPINNARNYGWMVIPIP